MFFLGIFLNSLKFLNSFSEENEIRRTYMFITSIKRWKFTSFLLVPVIAGLILMGAPMDPAWAKPGKGKGGPTPSVDPPAPSPGPLQITSLTALNNEARILAGRAGLNSLRLAIQLGAERPVWQQPHRAHAHGEPLACPLRQRLLQRQVTPTPEDVGRGGKGPEDKPLASSRQFLFAALGIDGPINFPIIGEPICNLVAGPLGPTQLGFVDPVEGFFQVGIDANADGCIDRNEVAMDPANRVAVDGAFKTPHLRNIELTGPYFHNGGFKTLLEVVELYDRGGNFCRFNFPDLDPDILFLGLRAAEEEGLVRFMIALTDERVREKQGPFDHPELLIPNGHSVFPDPLIAGQAQDDPLTLPAVGVGGVVPAGLPKLKAFHAGLDLTDGFVGHMEAGDVAGTPCSPQ
jgi:hypothetical protein